MSLEDGIDSDYLDEISDVLGKKYSFDILEGLDEPKTLNELKDEKDSIPPATLHRRINDLKDNNYVREVGYSIENSKNIRETRYETTGKAPRVLIQTALDISDKDEEELINSVLDGSDGI